MPALRDTNDCGDGDTYIAVGRSTTRTMQQIELVGGGPQDVHRGSAAVSGRDHRG